MANEGEPRGQILSRREALRLLGLGSVACFAAWGAPERIGAIDPVVGSEVIPALACVLRPELAMGPYFVDAQLNRSDIRYDPRAGTFSEGMPLSLRINVFNVTRRSCAPLEGARVDVWHCNAMGIYSGVIASAFNTFGQKFLRGYQLTNAHGGVQFQTIYPGWYSGRAVHIHFMIRTKATDSRDYQFTSQLFFSDALTDIVHATEHYVLKGKRNTRNIDDDLFKKGGYQLVLNTRGDNVNGYIGTINLGLDLTNAKVGAPDTFRPGDPP